MAGGRKSADWCKEACAEYEKRLRKPFDISWEYLDEDKLLKKLEKWPFRPNDYVICLDERGQNISSDEYAQLLNRAFLNDKEIVILIGGAYGFTDEIREKADFVWSFSKLVFPHLLARVMAVEQIYRASQILQNRPYHHI